MKHDVIMDPSKHDYMIIESEANRVAKEAAKALKRSRSACNDAKSGIPTWTGQSGSKRFVLSKHCLQQLFTLYDKSSLSSCEICTKLNIDICIKMVNKMKLHLLTRIFKMRTD